MLSLILAKSHYKENQRTIKIPLLPWGLFHQYCIKQAGHWLGHRIPFIISSI
jgi:hypothetical protein